MELSKLKVAEYLRTYCLTYNRSVKNNISMIDAFGEIINTNETTLQKEDFEAMLMIKDYYSSAKILSESRDVFLSGLYDKNDKLIADDSLPLNQSCLNNYKNKDIVLFTRNALSHNDDGPLKYWLVNGKNGKLKLHILLRGTKATKGINVGQVVPFEIEIDHYDLLRMGLHCISESNIFHIGGINYKSGIKKQARLLSNLRALKLLVDNTFYTYELFKPFSMREKTAISNFYAKSKMAELRELLRSKLEKHCRKELSIPQKLTIYYNIYNYILRAMVSDDAGIQLRGVTINDIEGFPRGAFASIIDKRYEYEALKVIPIGSEKKTVHLAALLNNMVASTFNGEKSVFEIMMKLHDDFLKDKSVKDIFAKFIVLDEREKQMALNVLFDIDYQQRENLSIYYGYMLDCLITDPEIKIGGKLYSREHLRDAFVHERWYFNISQDESWELYDCKNGMKNQFNFNWHKSIKNDDLFQTIEEYYRELKKKEKTNKR